MKKTQEARTAYHEAGHAITGFFDEYHPKVKMVTIQPGENYYGIVKSYSNKLTSKIEYEITPKNRMIIESIIISSYAGCIAEKKFSGRYDNQKAGQDRRNILSIAGYVAGGGKSLEKYLSWLWTVSEGKVNAYWKYIEIIAAALLDKKTLYFDDLVKLTNP